MSLEDLPSSFADYLGITATSAQIILSIVVIFMILLPALYLSKGNRMVALIFGFMGMCLCVGLTWLPFWFIIAAIALMTISLAKFGADITTGGD